MFYCNSSRDLQLLTERVLFGTWWFLCLVEWKTAHHHNTLRNITAGESKMPCRSPSVLAQCEAMGFFYCTCCEQHSALTIGATTGVDVFTKLSPTSKGAGAVCISTGKKGGRKEKQTLNKMQNTETRREEEHERLYRSVC